MSATDAIAIKTNLDATMDGGNLTPNQRLLMEMILSRENLEPNLVGPGTLPKLKYAIIREFPNNYPGLIEFVRENNPHLPIDLWGSSEQTASAHFIANLFMFRKGKEQPFEIWETIRDWNNEALDMFAFIKKTGNYVNLKTKEMVSESQVEKEIKLVISYGSGQKTYNRFDNCFKTGRRTEYDDCDMFPGNYGVSIDNVFNTWAGWHFKPSTQVGLKERKEIEGLFYRLRLHLCNGNELLLREFDNIIAYRVQNPDKLANHVVLISSNERGTGKTLFGECLQRIFGKHYISPPSSIVEGNFNGWAEHALVVHIDEAESTNTFNKSSEMKSTIDRTVTGEYLMINKKYINTFTVKNYVFFLITTNNPAPFYGSGEDRRLFILSPGDKLSAKIHGPLGKYKNEHGEIFGKVIYDYYMSLKLDNYKPKSDAYRTEYFYRMVELEKSGLDLFLEEWILDKAVFTNETLARRVAMMMEVRYSQKSMSMWLDRHGYKQLRIYLEDKTQRVWYRKGVEPSPEHLRCLLGKKGEVTF